jgi:glutathione synthase/RimK-type ligase-like ATP-grasp enzyme
MNFVLFSRITHQTGNSLAARLGIRGGETIPAKANIETLIRWGSSALVSNPINRTINAREAVELAANKFNAIDRLLAHNIAAPRQMKLAGLTEQTLQHITTVGLRLPVLARMFNHTRGKDILLCLQNKDINRAIRWGKQYVTEYIPTAREYRVHVFKDEIIRVSQKILMSRDVYVPYLRNDDHNHTFRNPRKSLSNEEKLTAIQAVRTLGLDFGAVDLVVADDNKHYVLEVNTGPALIDTGLDVYAEKITPLLG